MAKIFEKFSTHFSMQKIHRMHKLMSFIPNMIRLIPLYIYALEKWEINS